MGDLDGDGLGGAGPAERAACDLDGDGLLDVLGTSVVSGGGLATQTITVLATGRFDTICVGDLDGDARDDFVEADPW
jgi:hypothetical protein